MDLGRAVHRFSDAPGERAPGELALAAKDEQALAQLRDQVGLHAHHTDGDESQRPVLIEDEEHRGQGLTAQEKRSNERLADEAAERLDFVLDHRRHLGALHAAEARERKAQDVVVEHVTQPAQHALAHPALHRVDAELEPAVEDDQTEEDPDRRKRIEAPELHSEPRGFRGAVGEARRPGSPR